MFIKEKVFYQGKLYTVYFKYDSGYMEIVENDCTKAVKLVHEEDVIYQ